MKLKNCRTVKLPPTHPPTLAVTQHYSRYDSLSF